MPKILIVDDEETNREVLFDALEGEEYELAQAVDGEGCLRQADESFDLILLDVMMPGIDGIETLRKLKEHEATRDIPVIMVTALNMDSQVTACLDEGAVDHISKPFSNMVMRARIRAALRTRATGSSAADAHSTEPRGRLIVIVGSKGGVGTTTVALNVAARWVEVGKTVNLCEFQPYTGSLATYLGIQPQVNGSELLENATAQINRRVVEQCLVPHGSGIRVLLGPLNPAGGGEAAAEKTLALVRALREIAELTLLDIGTGYAEFHREILHQADHVVVVVEQEPGSLAAAKQKIESLVELGTQSSVITAVVNNRVQLPMPAVGLNELREQLDCPLSGVIPADPEGCAAAVRAGMPLIKTRLQSTASGAINALANRLGAAQMEAVAF